MSIKTDIIKALEAAGAAGVHQDELVASIDAKPASIWKMLRGLDGIHKDGEGRFYSNEARAEAAAADFELHGENMASQEAQPFAAEAEALAIMPRDCRLALAALREADGRNWLNVAALPWRNATSMIAGSANGRKPKPNPSSASNRIGAGPAISAPCAKLFPWRRACRHQRNGAPSCHKACQAFPPWLGWHTGNHAAPPLFPICDASAELTAGAMRERWRHRCRIALER